MNEKGQVSKLIFFDSQPAYSTFDYDFSVFDYDEKGNNILVKKYGETGLMYDAIGKMVEEISYKYDDYNNLINGQSLRYNARIKKRFELIYDSNQRLVKEEIEEIRCR